MDAIGQRATRTQTNINSSWRCISLVGEMSTVEGKSELKVCRLLTLLLTVHFYIEIYFMSEVKLGIIQGYSKEFWDHWQNVTFLDDVTLEIWVLYSEMIKNNVCTYFKLFFICTYNTAGPIENLGFIERLSFVRSPWVALLGTMFLLFYYTELLKYYCLH